MKYLVTWYLDEEEEDNQGHPLVIGMDHFVDIEPLCDSKGLYIGCNIMMLNDNTYRVTAKFNGIMQQIRELR